MPALIRSTHRADSGPPLQDLRLRDEERELIFKGPLKKRGGTQSESAELQVFLFDHAILMVKQKSKNEQYKVYRKVRSLPSPAPPARARPDSAPLARLAADPSRAPRRRTRR